MKTINNLLLLLLTIGNTSTATAQITVWDLMEIPEGGCPISPFQDTVVTEPAWKATEIDDYRRYYSRDTAPKLPKQLVSPDSISKLFKPLLAEGTPGSLPGDLTIFSEKELNDSLVSFLEGNRFGLKNRRGDTLIPATYHYIENTSLNRRFIGYGSRYVNVYNLDNTPLLPEQKYLHAESAGNGNFIVHQRSGFGLVDSTGKELLPCKYLDIHNVRSNGKTVVQVRDSKNTAFFFVPADQLKIQVPYRYEYSFLLHDRYLSVYNKKKPFDIVTRKDLTCDQDFEISFFNNLSSLLQIQDTRDKKHLDYHSRRMYPFSPSGQLLIQDTTVTNTNYYETGFFRVLKWERGAKSPLHGVVDTLGNWLIEPKYKEFEHLAPNYYAVKIESTPFDKVGVLDIRNGSMVIPFIYNGFKKRAYSQFVSFYRRVDTLSENEVTTLYHLPDLREVFTKSGHLEYFQYVLCTDTVLLENKGAKQAKYLLKTDGNLYIKDSFKLIFPKEQQGYWPYRMFDNTRGQVGCGGELLNLPYEKQFTTEKSVGDSIFLMKNKKSDYFLKTPAGEFPLESKIKSISPPGFRNLIVVRDDKRRSSIINITGQEILPPLPAFLSLPDKRSPYFIINLYGGYKDYIDRNGQLIFQGKYSAINKLNLGLFAVSQGGWVGVTDQSGRLILPISRSRTYLAGGMLIRENKTYFRDGTLMGE